MTARLFALMLVPGMLQAQVPEIQKIATATAVSTERLGVINSVRELPDGRLLVNDIMRRRLLIMDTTMKVVGVVLDSVAAASNSYGTGEGGTQLFPFRGDTTFFFDPQSLSIVVIDPQGRFVRVRSIWRVQDIRYLTGQYGYPTGDPSGRVVYRIAAQPAPPKIRPPAGIPYIPPEPDSAFLVAVHLDTRKLDTLAVLRIPKTEVQVRRSGDRSFMIDRIVNPLPMTDEWAVLPDGTIALVKGREYRIEYLHSDGSRTTSPRIPFDWKRLTDEDKQRLADSTRTAQLRLNSMNHASAMIRWVNQYNQLYPKNFKLPDGYVPQPGFPKDWIFPAGVTFPPNYVYACPPGVDRVSAMQGGSAETGMPSCLPAPITFGTQTPPAPTARPVLVPPAQDLPDYRPPFPPGSVRADAEGNVWVRTNPMVAAPGGPVFDVISPKGELFAKLQLPPGYSIVGFGKGRIVYLTTRDASGLHVARVRLK